MRKKAMMMMTKMPKSRLLPLSEGSAMSHPPKDHGHHRPQRKIFSPNNSQKVASKAPTIRSGCSCLHHNTVIKSLQTSCAILNSRSRTGRGPRDFPLQVCTISQILPRRTTGLISLLVGPIRQVIHPDIRPQHGPKLLGQVVKAISLQPRRSGHEQLLPHRVIRNTGHITRVPQVHVRYFRTLTHLEYPRKEHRVPEHHQPGRP
jgi:hypothetical protein